MNTLMNTNQTLIFLSAIKLDKKKMQVVTAFLQTYELKIKRLTHKSKDSFLAPFLINSNFFIESRKALSADQLMGLSHFLGQHLILTGIVSNNHILDFNRIALQQINNLLPF
jgi:hypothetical protein